MEKKHEQEPRPFHIQDAGYEKDRAKMRRQIERRLREELEAQTRKQRGFKHHEGHAAWKLDHYPYTERDRKLAGETHEEVLARQEKEFQAEVDRRMKEKDPVLERLHFPNGRQSALEAMEREKKIEAYKERTRREREEALKTTEQNRMKARQIIEEQKRRLATEQDNRKPLADLQKDFNRETEQGKFKADLERKIAAFKERTKQSLEGPSAAPEQDNGPDRNALRDGFNFSVVAAEYEAYLDEHKIGREEQSQDRDARIEAFKARWREDFERVSPGPQERDRER